MKKIIKLTESDLYNIVKKVLTEQLVNVVNTPEEVKKFQQLLVNQGYDLGKTGQQKNGVDGYIGRRTRGAIKDFQTKNNLKPTGVLDQITQNALSLKSLVTKQFGGKLPFDTTQIKSDTTKLKAPVKPSIKKPTQKGVVSAAAKNVAKCETGTSKVLATNAGLLFDGDKLYWLSNGKVIKSWSAVSGLTWKNTPINDWGKLLNRYTQNRQEWSKQKDAGPLPEGQYLVGPLETRSGQQEEIGELEAFWYKLTGQVEDVTDQNKQFCKNTILSRISWGNYRLKITPTGGQKMYNRGSFYIHGGSLEGSHGCIDLTDEMEDFAKFFGVWSSANNKKTLPMTVKYKNPSINRIIQKLVNL